MGASLDQFDPILIDAGVFESVGDLLGALLGLVQHGIGRSCTAVGNELDGEARVFFCGRSQGIDLGAEGWIALDIAPEHDHDPPIILHRKHIGHLG